MRIAVTGCNGRLGRYVVEAASRAGHTVVGVDLVGRSGPTGGPLERFYAVDITRYGPFLAALDGCEALVHLAAHPSPRSAPAHIVHNDNVSGSYNALRVAVDLGINRVCLASSVNAVGGAFSIHPRYDYFPLDEDHPGYAEDPYSLSKWSAELQADSVVRTRPAMTVSSLRLHALTSDRAQAVVASPGRSEQALRELWGYTEYTAAAAACLLSVNASFYGHERFYVVAPRTVAAEDSASLAARHYPETALRRRLNDHDGFFDCSKAERILGWRHPR